MKEPISIRSIASISPLGSSPEEVWESYLNPRPFLRREQVGHTEEWVARLPDAAKAAIHRLRQSDTNYRNLDDSVLFALYASRKAVAMADWSSGDNFGINLGSSRGATGLLEQYHSEFLEQRKTATLSSPTTTLGNISSWVAHDLQTRGPEISHSITCSTALHALLNGVAWLQSGMTDTFLVGGSEAPLTPFTIAQMKALKVYSNVRLSTSTPLSTDPVEAQSRDTIITYPCQALQLDKKRNTMVLGEGAAVACLEKGISKDTMALIEGIGYATELLEHNVSISADAVCFQRAMKMALGNIAPAEVDAIVMHAPGTVKGDLSEYKAIQQVFGDHMPALTTNKWKIGHTFGASGMLSVELAVLMLQRQQFVGVPFRVYDTEPKKLERVLVNAVGFGGNAVSVLLGKNI
ncbi:beta-ketoacyl synthase [Aggregatimonas sangjinii]|uniref:Beta-ketoacyl synthase n=1 Tax=Aggregatimonas sangjinii TaxID=2583587 RepID=A0A5B7SYY0_9FLAO|nr:beta-ketoacyl synthase N-terminal-like domain-containing protein [Aggregatimonas sangjinii]QCX02429.1 beta-ketoacyl synthase [Aggregatimonas sangjinii]